MPKRTPEQKAARKIADAENRKRNHAALLAAEKKYREEHAEELRAYKAQWKKDNPEKVRVSRRIYKKTHPRKEAEKAARKKPEPVAKSRASALRWRRENYERSRARQKEWEQSTEGKAWRAVWGGKYRLDHKEEFTARQHNRRARKLEAGGEHTAMDVMGLWELQGGKCVFFSSCGNVLRKGHRREWHVDHIEPLVPKTPSRPRGKNSVDNLQLLCAPCNRKKHNTDPYAFAQQNGLLFCDIVDIQKPKRKKSGQKPPSPPKT